MGRLKYEYLKCFPLFIIFYFIFHLLSTFVLNYSTPDSYGETILILTLAFIGFVYIIYKQNNDKKSGIYFNNNEMIVLKYKRHNCPWSKVKAERIFKISNFFQIIRISFLDSDFSIMIVLFAPSIKSIAENTHTYVPKDHDFYKFVNEYNN